MGKTWDFPEENQALDLHKTSCPWTDKHIGLWLGRILGSVNGEEILLISCRFIRSLRACLWNTS